jgi:hypothetical protein
MMRLPRFSTRDLIVGTTMLAVGLGLISMVYRGWLAQSQYALFASYFGGPALAGAGAFYPFKLTTEGAVIGTILAILNALFPLYPVN